MNSEDLLEGVNDGDYVIYNDVSPEWWEVGEDFVEKLPMASFGRRLIILAKQNLNQKIRDIEKDIKSDTSGPFQKVLVSLLQADRPNSNMVDKTQAKSDSQSLLNAGVKKWGTNEQSFVTVFCTKSYSQLRAMFEEYKTISGHSIEDDIKKEMSGDLSKCFLSISNFHFLLYIF